MLRINVLSKNLKSILRARKWRLSHSAEMKEYQKQYNKSNPERNRRANRRALERNKGVIIAAKSKPCVDCGNSYHHTVMDLDHLPGVDKKFRLAEQNHLSVKKVQDEIDKCEVVCANCHRIRTWNRSHITNQILGGVWKTK